jgi:hypothetical protein
MADEARVLIAFMELAFDSGVQRYCTADATITWNGQEWIGGARFLNIGTKNHRSSTEATSWDVEFSALPVALVAQALLEPVRGRRWALWINEYVYTPEARTFVQTLHVDAGLMDTGNLQDDAGTIA